MGWPRARRLLGEGVVAPARAAAATATAAPTSSASLLQLSVPRAAAPASCALTQRQPRVFPCLPAFKIADSFRARESLRAGIDSFVLGMLHEDSPRDSVDASVV